MYRTVLVAAGISMLLAGIAATAQDDGIRRLPPGAFPELPAKVARQLERRHCLIPQEAFSRQRSNVIHGAFTGAGKSEWAVLCSVNGSSAILVFSPGAESKPAELARYEDRDYMQSDADGRMVFSRGISAVGEDFILSHYRAYGGPKPPPIEHLGIDDAFLEKASVIHYYYAHQGQWLWLVGSD